MKILFLSIILLFGIQMIVLYLFGQPVICTCGTIKLWTGMVVSADNSQHISDWYTFSHIIHGFIFFYLLKAVFKKSSNKANLLIALVIEIAWELTENTPWIINRYRQQALAQGYIGDSIINSVSDSLFMLFGYIVAWKLKAWKIILIALFLEIWVGYMIRDNLTLNIINLIYPSPIIKQWQSSI